LPVAEEELRKRDDGVLGSETKPAEVTLKVRRLSLESAVIRRFRCREPAGSGHLL
jgi:hypothetical protein